MIKSYLGYVWACAVGFDASPYERVRLVWDWPQLRYAYLSKAAGVFNFYRIIEQSRYVCERMWICVFVWFCCERVWLDASVIDLNASTRTIQKPQVRNFTLWTKHHLIGINYSSYPFCVSLMRKCGPLLLLFYVGFFKCMLIYLLTV